MAWANTQQVEEPGRRVISLAGPRRGAAGH